MIFDITQVSPNEEVVAQHKTLETVSVWCLTDVLYVLITSVFAGRSRGTWD